MAARRPLGTLTNTQPAAPPPTKPAAPKPAVYRCDHCFSFTGSYAAVAAHEATCPCAAPSIKREAAPPPPAAPAPKRRVPLWVLVCFLWAGYEAARPLPQPVCPARPRPFDEILIEQLADVARRSARAHGCGVRVRRCRDTRRAKPQQLQQPVRGSASYATVPGAHTAQTTCDRGTEAEGQHASSKTDQSACNHGITNDCMHQGRQSIVPRHMIHVVMAKPTVQHALNHR